MSKGIAFMTVVGILSALVLAACSSGRGGQPQPQPPDVATEAGQPVEPGQTAGAPGGGNTVPGDVPVISGAYNLQVVAGASQISFQVDQEISEVVTFYQTELEAFGWQMTRSQDSIVGLIASLVRTNDQGDRLSVDMQFNPNSAFTVVQIAVVRSQ